MPVSCKDGTACVDAIGALQTTVDAIDDTSAATLCSAGQYLDGDGNCVTGAVLLHNTVYVALNGTPAGPGTVGGKSGPWSPK